MCLASVERYFRGLGMAKIIFIEIEELSKPKFGRPHSKIAINPAYIVSLRAVSATETRINLTNQEPVTVLCPYQELLDRLS